MDITVNGNQYRTSGPLNALQQLHVSRRVAPVLASMGISLSSLRAGVKISPEDVAFSLGPVSEVVASMSDETVEYVVGTCLSVVQRKQPQAGSVSGQALWAPVAQGAAPMFADIDMPVMMRLVVGVLAENLGNFLKELDGGAAPSTSS